MKTLHKLITFVCISMTVAVIAVLLITDISKNKTEICLTRSCNRAASAILDYMDPNVNPCDDFYKFVCGNFLKKDLPEEMLTKNVFTMTYQTVLEEVKIVLEKPIETDDPKYLDPMRKFYRACMNTAAIEKNSLKTMQEIVEELGGWPVMGSENWNEEDFDWVQYVYKFKKIGLSINSFFDFSVLYGGPKRPSTIKLDQPSLGLEREYLLEGFSDKTVQAYYEYMVNVAVLLGSDEEEAARLLKESLSFEMQLANITIPSAERFNPINGIHLVTVGAIQRDLPSFPWIEYLNAIKGDITKEDTIALFATQYFIGFEVLINKTSKRIITNYAVWRAIDSCLPFMSNSFQEVRLKFLKVLIGQQVRGERWKECIGQMFKGGLEDHINDAYHDRYLTRESRDENPIAAEVSRYVTEALRNALNSTAWMDQTTKKYAFLKVSDMTTRLVTYSDVKMQNYEASKLDENNYLKSFLYVMQWKTSLQLVSLTRSFSGRRNRRNVLPKCIDAYFLERVTQTVVGDGMLEEPFFVNNRPQYLNYAAFGFVIAQAMSHGFDDEGRQHFRDKNVNLWSPETEEIYFEKVRCLIEQYGNYTIPELNLQVNGVNTMRENLADNRGINLAYSAYRMWTEQNWVEKRLPGMKYTPNQMFWIFTTHLLCEKSKPEFLNFRLLIDDHSPPYFRAVGILANTKYLAEDFQCPVGSAMNPGDGKKCEVW